MVDRSGLGLVGFIFASVTFAVMLTTTMVVKGYSDGVYSLESAAIEGRQDMYLRDFIAPGSGRRLRQSGLGLVLASQWMCRAEHCEQSSEHGGSVPNAKLGSL